MTQLFHLIEQYGLLIVFANVFVEQLGAPLPAYPTLVITGALADAGSYSVPVLLLTAVVAALLADLFWYHAGRRYGAKVMATLCRISISPDSCARQTSAVYTRWGARSLLVAKFIPGFASLASALAGMVGTPRRTFMLFDALGAAIWAGSAIFLGSLFSSAIDQLLLVLAELGRWGLLLVAIAFAVFLAKKWWNRHSLLKSLKMTRITVDELADLRTRGMAPVIIDVRAKLAQNEGRIPGAIRVAPDEATAFALAGRPDDEVIVYCACPNEISAAQFAQQLMRQGYTRVRPLTGGIDAWVAAGHTIEKSL